MSSQLDRIESMLRALCDHLGVQSFDKSGNGSRDASETGSDRYTGVVSRFEHGWGFIECEAMNRNFFVHYSDIEGTGMRSLEAGENVSFELAPGKDGRPKAVRVRRQASGRAYRSFKPIGVARSDAGLSAPSGGSSLSEPVFEPARPARSGAGLDGAHELPGEEPDELEASPEDAELPASGNRRGRT